jgi:hypothetical protein
LRKAYFGEVEIAFDAMKNVLRELAFSIQVENGFTLGGNGFEVKLGVFLTVAGRSNSAFRIFTGLQELKPVLIFAAQVLAVLSSLPQFAERSFHTGYSGLAFLLSSFLRLFARILIQL